MNNQQYRIRHVSWLVLATLSVWCFPASSLELMSYEQKYLGNTYGVVPIKIDSANYADLCISVTGADRSIRFDLKKAPYGADVIIKQQRTNNPTGFLLEASTSKYRAKQTYVVQTNVQK